MSPSVVNHDIERPSLELIERASKFGAATLHEAAGQIGAFPSAIKPVAAKFRLCGPAVTVLSPPHDNLWLHRAIYVARPGDVLVVDTGGYFEAGYWGEIMSTAALARKLGGVLIDGCARDGTLLEELGLPVFSRGLCIRGTGKDLNAVGGINVPVRIGEVPVFPGDLVLGDADGLVAIPRADVADVIEKAASREAKEAGIILALESGQRTLDLYGWPDQ